MTHNELGVMKESAEKLDQKDNLAVFRDRFYIPENTIYVNGNSLGLLPKDGERTLLRVLNEWKNQVVKGWIHTEKPWF